MENIYSYLRMFQPDRRVSVTNLHTPDRISSLKLLLKEGGSRPAIAKDTAQPWPGLGLYLGDGVIFLDASVERESVHCSARNRGNRLSDGVFILSPSRFLEARLGMARVLPQFLEKTTQNHGNDIKFNVIVNFSGMSISEFKTLLSMEIENVCYNPSQGYSNCDFQFCFFKNNAESGESYYHFHNSDSVNSLVSNLQDIGNVYFSTGSKISLEDIDLTKDPDKINVVIVCDILGNSEGFNDRTFSEFSEKIYIRCRDWTGSGHPRTSMRFHGRGSGSPMRDIFKMMSFYTPFFGKYGASAIDLLDLPRFYVENLHRVRPTHIIVPSPEFTAREAVHGVGLEYSMENVYSFWNGRRSVSTDRWILGIDGKYFACNGPVAYDRIRDHYHAVRWNMKNNERILFCP